MFRLPLSFAVSFVGSRLFFFAQYFVNRGLSYYDSIKRSKLKDSQLQVPYDPLLPHLFFGEEAVMAARLFTHGIETLSMQHTFQPIYDCSFSFFLGYSFFAPLKSVIFHLYSRAHRPTSCPLLLTTDSRDLFQNSGSKQAPNSSIAALQARARALSQLRVRFILSSTNNDIFDGLHPDEVIELSLHCRRGERFGLGALLRSCAFFLLIQSGDFILCRYDPNSRRV